MMAKRSIYADILIVLGIAFISMALQVALLKLGVLKIFFDAPLIILFLFDSVWVAVSIMVGFIVTKPMFKAQIFLAIVMGLLASGLGIFLTSQGLFDLVLSWPEFFQYLFNVVYLFIFMMGSVNILEQVIIPNKKMFKFLR